jgi:hypothetical protein
VGWICHGFKGSGFRVQRFRGSGFWVQRFWVLSSKEGKVPGSPFWVQRLKKLIETS